jgi:hypothetical protein
MPQLFTNYIFAVLGTVMMMMMICYDVSFPILIFDFLKLQVLEACEHRTLVPFAESFFHALVLAFQPLHPSPPALLSCDGGEFIVLQPWHWWPLRHYGLGSCQVQVSGEDACASCCS